MTEIWRGRRLWIEQRSVELPSGKKEFVVVHPGGAVAILPVDGDEVVLIRQYRAAIDAWILEAPAGTLEEGEEPAVCAARELIEETGPRGLGARPPRRDLHHARVLGRGDPPLPRSRAFALHGLRQGRGRADRGRPVPRGRGPGHGPRRPHPRREDPLPGPPRARVTDMRTLALCLALALLLLAAGCTQSPGAGHASTSTATAGSRSRSRRTPG